MNTSKIYIDKKIADQVKHVCKWRTGEQRKYSAKYITDDLYEFIKGPLKDKMIGPELKKKLSEEDFKKNKDDYDRFRSFTIAKSTLQNAFTEGVGVLWDNYRHLEEILKLYIDEFISHCPPMRQAEEKKSTTYPETQVVKIPGFNKEPLFSKDVITQIKNQAGSFCTLKNCRIRTETNSRTKPGEIIGFGTANMIYGCRQGDPRYEENPPVNVYAAENGIWLCVNHSILVNAVNGEDYTAIELYKLKEIHMEFLREMAEGKKSINIMGFHSTRNEIPDVSALLKYLEDQDFLFSLPAAVNVGNITVQAETLMTFLSHELKTKTLVYSVFLLKQLASLQYLCNALLNKSASVGAFADFLDVFLVFQKMVGLVFDEISVKYSLPLEGRLLLITPQHK